MRLVSTIKYFLKPLHQIPAVLLRYLSIEFRDHIRLSMAGIPLYRLDVAAGERQLIGDAAVPQATVIFLS